MKTTRYGNTVSAKNNKIFTSDDGSLISIGVMCDESNNKWWRIRKDGIDIDLGIKTFSNLGNVFYDEGEIYERID